MLRWRLAENLRGTVAVESLPGIQPLVLFAHKLGDSSNRFRVQINHLEAEKKGFVVDDNARNAAFAVLVSSRRRRSRGAWRLFRLEGDKDWEVLGGGVEHVVLQQANSAIKLRIILSTGRAFMIDFIRYSNNYDLISDFGRTKGFFKGQPSGVMHLTLEEVESLTSMSWRFQDIDNDNTGTVTRNNYVSKSLSLLFGLIIPAWISSRSTPASNNSSRISKDRHIQVIFLKDGGHLYNHPRPSLRSSAGP